jgi:hypothetical protein
MSNWQIEVDNIKRCSQRQDSLTEQLKDLIIVAEKLGFYDASDYLKMTIKQ